MRSSLRLVVIAALAGSFMAGRASSRQAAQEPASASCPPAGVGAVISEVAPAQPWAVQGFRGAECQILGDIPECD